MKKPQISWSDDDVARLRALWATPLTSGQIGVEMGRTGKSVKRKAHKLRLASKNPMSGADVMAQLREGRSILATERFSSQITIEEDGCWVWTGPTAHGYADAVLAQRHYLLHRLSYELSRGEIPAGMNVCHECDNPTCVRPDHLFLGTQRDNINDMMRKGRHAAHIKKKALAE